MRIAAALIGLGLICAGCATAGVTPSLPDPVVATGHDLAAQTCAACHAIGPTGASPNRRAPPFRTLAGRYVPLTLHHRLTEIAETGHYDMAPVPVHSDEVEALAAYINSLAKP